MRKNWLRYVGMAVVALALVIAVLPLATHKPYRGDIPMAALLVVVGVMSMRKARKLDHN